VGDDPRTPPSLSNAKDGNRAWISHVETLFDPNIVGKSNIDKDLQIEDIRAELLNSWISPEKGLPKGSRPLCCLQSRLKVLQQCLLPQNGKHPLEINEEA
jgi:hypothetical protein